MEIAWWDGYLGASSREPDLREHTMRYRLLGPVEVVGEDGQVVALAGGRERVLLSTLVLGANHTVSTDRLVDALWGDDPPATAANALQVHVSKLRKKLAAAGAGENLSSAPQGYVLRTRPDEIDLEEFERLVSATTGGDPAEISLNLRRALALWRGPALADVSSDLLQGEKSRLEELRLLTLERCIEAELALGRHLELIGELEALVQADRLREGPRRQLMLALYRSGRQADALATYRAGRELLAEELGIDPGSELQALELAILNQDPNLAAPAASAVFTSTHPIPPSGTLTLLMTDIEGSTRLWETKPEEMSAALARHDHILRSTIEANGGYVFKTVGDAFCATFATATDAIGAAEAVQRAFIAEPWPGGAIVRVRMGLHTGEFEERDGDYFGPGVNRLARLTSIGHGGQVLVSRSTADVVLDHLAAGHCLRDLGTHRLKDLSRPEMVFQLEVGGLPNEFPPLRSLDNPALLNNLPIQVTSFVGRDELLAELRCALGDHRLVTLAGPGGAGKTRLALQMAAELVEGLSHGVWFLDFSALTDPELVVPTAMTVLGLREVPGQGPEKSLIEALVDRELVLIFDNCEHLIEQCARLADGLLRSCPGVRILVTTREPLGIAGEQIHRIGPLAVPELSDDVGAVRKAEAVQLLIERTQAHHPRFVVTDDNATALTSLCRRLDGIPLAIELAAARLRTMSLDDIEDRLDERFRLLTGGSRAALARQRTLDALVGWSYDLLNGSEQTVLARLGVCAGTFDLAAAEAIAVGPAEPWEVPDLLGSLVDKSLVQVDESELGVRYYFLETIRHFAVGRLAAAGEGVSHDARLTHARYYRQVAEANEWGGLGPDFEQWAARLDADRDNFLVALEVFLGEEDGGKEACRLVAALRWYWVETDAQSGAAQLLPRLLERSDVVDATIERARMLVTAAHLQDHAGQASARPLLEEALAIGEAVGDASVVAEACGLLMWNRYLGGDSKAGAELGDRAVESARESGNPLLLIMVLNFRGICGRDPRRVRACWAEALELCESFGDVWWSAVITNNLGCLEARLGDYHEARALLERALAARPIGRSKWVRANFLQGLGIVLLALGDVSGAAQRFGDCLILADQCNADTELAHGVLGASLVASALGLFEAAAALFGAVDRRFEVIGTKPATIDGGMLEAAAHAVREQLGHYFDETFQFGRSLSRGEALERALNTVNTVAEETFVPGTHWRDRDGRPQPG